MVLVTKAKLSYVEPG